LGLGACWLVVVGKVWLVLAVWGLLMGMLEERRLGYRGMRKVNQALAETLVAE